MRWIVYFLLFANLGLFIWKIRDYQQAPKPQVPSMAQGNQVNRLPLLSEMSAGAVRAREPEAIPGSVDTAATDADGVTDSAPGAGNAELPKCITVGPLRDEAATLRVREWLGARQASFAVREDERRETARYWVYFPPLESRQAAISRVSEMRAAGIQDLIIIPRGDMTNAISLGVYTRKASVDRRLAQLRAKGYQPSVVPRYRTVKATWIDVLATDPGVNTRTFSADFPTFDINSRQCSAAQIASMSKSPYNPQPPPRRYLYSGPETASPDMDFPAADNSAEGGMTP